MRKALILFQKFVKPSPLELYTFWAPIPSLDAQPGLGWGAGLILERARVPVTPFFSDGHTENLLTVPTWHTEYFSHSNFYFSHSNFYFL
jgi:hypothetical protein